MPAEINGTPNASDVAAPPSNPKINKISTTLPQIYLFDLFKIGRQA